MGKAYAKLFYHFVWTTKNRAPTITETSRVVLLDTIVRKCHDLGAEVLAANAVQDHVHLLIKLPPTLAPTQFIRQIKGATSYVLNRSDEMGLHWQRGYGVHTLSTAQLKSVRSYVEGQAEHHTSGRVLPSLERAEQQGD